MSIVHIELHVGDEIHVTGAPRPPAAHAPEPPMCSAHPHWRFFSPDEEAIIKAATTTWQTADELARAIGIPKSGEFCALLRNLVGRDVLESQQSKGYRLKPTPAP